MKDHMLLLKGGSLWDQVILNGMYTALSVEHFCRKVHRAIQNVNDFMSCHQTAHTNCHQIA